MKKKKTTKNKINKTSLKKRKEKSKQRVFQVYYKDRKKEQRECWVYKDRN